MDRFRAAQGKLGTPTVALCAIVVVAAGLSGVVLLALPGSTGRYFSWTLRPPGAAALIGGLYLASAVVFAWALVLSWSQVRVLVVGVLGLAVPTLILTLVHDEVFDFSRWQALAWVALFVTAPFSALLILLTAPSASRDGTRLPGWSRAGLAVVAIAMGVLAVLIWVDASREVLSRHSPVDLLRLTGTYVGAWCSFLAVVTGWAAARGGWDDARMAFVTLAAAGGGATLAFLRTRGELRRPFVAVSAALAAARGGRDGVPGGRPSGRSPGERASAGSFGPLSTGVGGRDGAPRCVGLEIGIRSGCRRPTRPSSAR